MKTLLIAAVMTLVANTVFAFEIDFSRRKPFMKSNEVQGEAPQMTLTPEPTSVENVKVNFESSQDVVILNTDKGFVPKSLALREGVKYKIHVVNVNDKEKRKLHHERICSAPWNLLWTNQNF